MSMKFAGWLTERQIGGCLALILAAPTAKAAATPWRDAAPAREEHSAALSGTEEAATGSRDEKPIANSAQPGAILPDAPEVAQSPSTDSNGQNGSSNPSPGQQQNDQQQNDQQQNGAAQPVGTAAAPGETAGGVAASTPAGAAIAPAKQRRVRTFLISIGVVVAACVAVGTIAGLSRTSPSQPK